MYNLTNRHSENEISFQSVFKCNMYQAITEIDIERFFVKYAPSGERFNKQLAIKVNNSQFYEFPAASSCFNLCLI